MAFREKKRYILWLPVTALLIGLGVLLFQCCRFAWGRIAGDFFYPYLEVSRWGRNIIRDKSLLSLDKYELVSQLEALQQQNRVLSSNAAALGELMLENEDLRRINNMDKYRGYRIVTAEVMLRDPIYWDESIRLNRGARHGVVPGAAALSVEPGSGRAILIGVVKEVTANSCRMVTLKSPEAKLSVRLPTSDAIGFINAENSLNGLGRVGYLPIGKEYQVDEEIESTGFETNVPGGIFLGKLLQIEDSDRMYGGKTYVNGRIAPAGNLSTLKFVVLVMRNESTPADLKSP